MSHLLYLGSMLLLVCGQRPKSQGITGVIIVSVVLGFFISKSLATSLSLSLSIFIIISTFSLFVLFLYFYYLFILSSHITHSINLAVYL